MMSIENGVHPLKNEPTMNPTETVHVDKFEWKTPFETVKVVIQCDSFGTVAKQWLKLAMENACWPCKNWKKERSKNNSTTREIRCN